MPSIYFKIFKMKKTLFLLLVNLLLINFVKAQHIEVKYNRNKITKTKEHKDIQNEYVLFYNQGKSIFLEDKQRLSSKLKNDISEQEYLLNFDISDKKLFYYKDFNRNELVSILDVYQVKDSLINWNWEITDETKEVAGYLCKKAVSNFQGFPFVAWYTEDIPISAGPEIYDGLPGLILQAYNLGYEYVSSSIKFLDNSINIERPKLKDETYTFLAAQEEILKKIRNPESNVEFSGDENITKVLAE